MAGGSGSSIAGMCFLRKVPGVFEGFAAFGRFRRVSEVSAWQGPGKSWLSRKFCSLESSTDSLKASGFEEVRSCQVSFTRHQNL